MIKNSFFVLFFCMASTCCIGQANDSLIKNYIERDTADSVFYYRDFDWCSFKGIEQLNTAELRYPFVKTIFRKEKLILKVHYSQTKTNQVNFFRLQDRWCLHYWRQDHGTMKHSFLFGMDSFMLEIDFLRDPFDTTNTHQARLLRVSVRRNVKDTVITREYYQFFKNDISRIPDLKSFDESYYDKVCNSHTYAKKYIQKGKIHSGFISDYGTSFDKKPPSWHWNALPASYKSVFFEEFQDMEDGDRSMNIKEILNNLKKIFTKDIEN